MWQGESEGRYKDATDEGNQTIRIRVKEEEKGQGENRKEERDEKRKKERPREWRDNTVSSRRGKLPVNNP